MHRPASAGRHARTLPRLRLSHSGTTLEDRLTAYGHTAGRTLTCLRRSHRRCRTSLLRRGRVYGARPSLRRNYATHWSRGRLRALLLRGVGDRSCLNCRRSRRRRDLYRRWSLTLLCCRRLSRSRSLRSSNWRTWSRRSGLLRRRRSSRRRRSERRALPQHRLDYALRRSFRSGCGRCSGNRLFSNRGWRRCRFRRRSGRRSDSFRNGRRRSFGLLL